MSEYKFQVSSGSDSAQSICAELARQFYDSPDTNACDIRWELVIRCEGHKAVCYSEYEVDEDYLYDLICDSFFLPDAESWAEYFRRVGSATEGLKLYDVEITSRRIKE